jgi:hypothetical protein
MGVEFRSQRSKQNFKSSSKVYNVGLTPNAGKRILKAFQRKFKEVELNNLNP